MPFAFFSRLASRGHSAAERHSVKNVMTPMTLLCAVASTVCFAAAFALRDSPFLSTLLVLVGIVPVLTGCGMYVYFSLRDPDRLHSEDFRLRRQILELTESKGGEIEVSPLELASIANPYPQPKLLGSDDEPRRLESPKEGENDE